MISQAKGQTKAEGGGAPTKINRIVIHIGMRKTGSTAIQYAMRFGVQEWIRQGVYPAVPRGKSFIEITSSFRDKTPMGQTVIAQSVRQAIDLGLDTVFVSSENFYHTSDDVKRSVVEFCQSLAHNVDILLFVRPQEDYIESLYSQLVTAGLWIGNIQSEPQKFVDQYAPELYYIERAAIWKYLGASVNIEPYISSDNLKRVCSFFGIDDGNMPRGGVNPRDGADLMRICVHVGELIAARNSIAIHQSYSLNRHVDFRGIFRGGVRGALGQVAEPKVSILEPATRQAIRRQFRESNSQLTKVTEEFLAGRDDLPFADLSIDALSPAASQAFRDYLILWVANAASATPAQPPQAAP